MRYFVLWDGKQEVSASATPYIEKLAPAAAGQTWIEISGDIAIHTCDASGNTVARPIPLEVAKGSAWAIAKAYRAKKMSAGCPSPLGVVQTDPSSRDAITQATADAMNNKVAVPAWSINWVMSDNSVKAHNAVQMVAMGAAVRAYITACQAASQSIRTAIYSATSVAAVAAIDITAGYPASS